MRFDESNGSQKEHLPNVMDEPPISEAIRQMAIGDVWPIEENLLGSSDDDAPPVQRRTRQFTAQENAAPNANGNLDTNAEQNGNHEDNGNTNASR